MTRLGCNFEGCSAFIQTLEPVTPVATYTCRAHVKKTPGKVLHFQDSQFDPGVRSGTDPRRYESGYTAPGKRDRGENPNEPGRHSSSTPNKFIDKIIKQASSELSGHKNREKIIDTLKEEVRDHNDGVTKSIDLGEISE